MKIRDLTLIPLFSALISVCAWITIPVPFAAPITLQTFAVFLTYMLLGGKRGSFSVLVYILLGAVGVPVFSGFRGGLSHIFSPGGGYIIGFLGMGLVCLLFETVFRRVRYGYAVGALIGLLVCYLFGTVWFVALYEGNIDFISVLLMCVIPYIPFDLLKFSLACIVAKKLKYYIGKTKI